MAFEALVHKIVSDNKQKKAEESRRNHLFGHVTNNIKVGLVGLPNSGKTALFSAITKTPIPLDNSPFSTIDPNIAICDHFDKRLLWLTSSYKPSELSPQKLTFFDTCSIVKGSYRGEGMGSSGLDVLGHMDILCLVLRAFEDDTITHVEGGIDPVRDLHILSQELIEKDRECVSQLLLQLERLVEGNIGGAEKKFEYNTLIKVYDMLFGVSYRDILVSKKLQSSKQKKKSSKTYTANQDTKKLANGENEPLPPLMIRFGAWNSAELKLLNKFQFLTAKEVVVVPNLLKRDLFRPVNRWTPAIEAAIVEADYTNKFKLGQVVQICAIWEHEILILQEQQDWEAYQAANPAHVSSAQLLADSFYQTLNFITFFTASEHLVKAWTVREGTTAPQAAGTIHTYWERGFVCAEVMTADDLFELENEQMVRLTGKMRQEGRRYIVAEGDVIAFQYNNEER